MLPTKFRYSWSAILEKFFFLIDQPETRFAYGGHVC
jgi:hypothetical protein